MFNIHGLLGPNKLLLALISTLLSFARENQMTLPVFNELHAVSDLHLGGKPGFQIFNQGDTLAAFITALANRPAKRRIGLVLNGDIVDFLAEDKAGYLDPLGAVDKLADIYERQAFTAVWSALEEFVAKTNRHLVLVLGNHDVELGLPNVQQWLLDRLTQGKDEHRGRVTTSFGGAGYACMVGDKKVLCVHGNEVDGWNVVDQQQLLNVSRELNRGNPPPEWDANAGTRMVIDVMNSVKRKYPMVDLLKPEIEAVVPILLTLDPGRLKQIGTILKVAAVRGRDAVRGRLGFLSAEDEIDGTEVSEQQVLDGFLSEHFDYGIKPQTNTDDLLSDAFDAIDSGTAAHEAEEEEFLGAMDYVTAIFGSAEKKTERLRKALRKNLEDNRAFDPGFKDHSFEALDKIVGDDVDYLIAGHTHLERALERDSGGFYFNSGTWIRLIRLNNEILDHAAQFERVFSAFKSNTIETLDKLNDLGPSGDQSLILLRPTVVSITEQRGKTVGELNHAQADGALQSVPDTRLSRG